MLTLKEFGNYPVDVPDDSGTPAGGSAHVEIEVTPEMIEAGLEVYCGKWVRDDPAEEVVTAIFRAMIALLKKS